MFVCSLHFVATDYSLASYSAKNRHLKKTAVPSQNLPTVTHPTSSETSTSEKGCMRRERYEKRLAEAHSAPTQEVGLVLGFDSPPPRTEEIGTSMEEAEMLLFFASSEPEPQTKNVSVQAGHPVIQTRDIGTQVCSGDFTTSIINVISTERKLKIAPGISSLELLTRIVLLFSMLSPENNRHSMNNKTKIILTFMKLKLNFSFVFQSILFGGTAATCSNVFKSTAVTLATIMHGMIPWPSKTEIVCNMPKCFNKYKKTRIVLDCTEIGTFKSKCLKCRIMSYSYYKGGQTMKYLIGVSPACLITYLSPGYGGRASDKAMFMDSGLITKLDSYVDDIMVDKGFLIKDVCDQFGLICPPFYGKKKPSVKRKRSLLVILPRHVFTWNEQ